jgi:hypothetical protein
VSSEQTIERPRAKEAAKTETTGVRGGRPPPASGGRDLRLDFFRGLALVFIFIDHIPENILSYFTLQSAQFYDAAEVFIFISGYTAALVYGRTMAGQGALYGTAQILRRAWQLYVAHIFLFVIFIAEVSYTVMTFHNPMYNDEMRVGDFLGEPHIAVIEALLLQFQPTYLDILPVYIVLLVTFPVVIVGLRWRPLVVLLPSFALYVIVQALNLSVPAYPPGTVWYFNPLAWQFLFTTGAALSLGVVPASLLRRSKRALLAAAAVVLLVGFVVRFSWTIHGLWDPFPGLWLRELWPVNKTNLSPLRLVPFLAAVALVAALVPPGAAFLRSSAARPLVLCGRQSLEIFCLGILLSALGHFVLSEYETGVPAKIAVNAVGIAIMYLTARTIDWYKTMGRAPPRPMTATSPAREDGFGR